MKTSVKMALTTGALAVAGGLFLVGSSYAEGGFGRHGGMGMGGFGELRRDMLKNVDTNGDGSLSQDEINAAVAGRLTEFDADKNGSLSLAEFEALWAEITKPVAVRAFQFLDPDGDAALSKAELEDRFGSMVSRMDRNDDGVLSAADHRRGGGHGPRGWRNWWQQSPEEQGSEDGPPPPPQP